MTEPITLETPGPKCPHCNSPKIMPSPFTYWVCKACLKYFDTPKR